MDTPSQEPVVYRISHRFNYASVNLVNALAGHLGYDPYHFLTHPFSSLVPERGFFASTHASHHDEIPVEALRDINARLMMAKAGRDKTEDVLADNWRFGRPSPDLLVINQGSGISPDIMTLFPKRPKTLFYAECHRIGDFYPRPEWPMPESMHDMDDNYEKRAVAYAESCDAIIVPSEYARTLWPERYRHKVHPIFEGFDTDFLAPERIHALSKFGPLVKRRFQGKRLVAFIGETIEPIRGFDRWMEAYLALRERYDDLHFIVVSNDRIKYGDIGKPDYHGITSFKDWTLDKLGLGNGEAEDISWLGMLPLYDYLSLLSVLDVVLYPMYGMFANWSLFHALHMGAPVVAADRAYLPEVIKEGENGLLADPDDIGDMVAKASILLDDPDLRAKFQANGRTTVEGKYSLAQTAEKLSRLLEDLGAAPSKAPSRAAPSDPPENRPIGLYVAVETADVDALETLLEAVTALAPTPPPLFLADKSHPGLSESAFDAHPNVVYRRFPVTTEKAVALNVIMQAHPADLMVKIEPRGTLPGPGWLEDLLAAHEKTPDLVGGNLLPTTLDAEEEGTFGLQIDGGRLLDSGRDLVRMAPEVMVVSRQVFEACGYLDERISYPLHDKEFSLRVQGMDLKPIQLV